MKNQDGAVTNGEADASIESLKAGNVVPAREFFDSYDIGKAGIAPTGGGSNPSQVIPIELKLLRVVVGHPMRRSSEYERVYT